MNPRYLELDELLQMVDEPYRSGFRTLLARDGAAMAAARGSTCNHQAWSGGYVDHLLEVMNIAVLLYDTLGRVRPFPFTLSDALVVLFVHDLEKPWSYVNGAEGWHRSEALSTKDAAQAFKIAKLSEYGIELTAELARGVRYAEGEVDRYSNRERGMSPLAAFAHMCDVASARLWHDHPLEADDPWPGATRSRAATFEEDLR